MSIYLGQLGRLVELKCPASQQVTPEDRYTFQTTLEGRVKAQARPIGRRVWTLGTSDATTPADQGAILSFADGEWGAGPFMFVSADAPVMNLLSPAVASCERSENYYSAVDTSGPMRLLDGEWSGRSYAADGAQTILFGALEEGEIVPGQRVPVLPGRKVTASVYVRGSMSYCGMAFYDSSGTKMAFHDSTVRGTAANTARSYVTASPPAGAASCRVYAKATQASRPAITWTDSLFDWADGQGCPKAVIHAASRSLVMASHDARGGRYSNLSFTVTEVG